MSTVDEDLRALFQEPSQGSYPVPPKSPPPPQPDSTIKTNADFVTRNEAGLYLFRGRLPALAASTVLGQMRERDRAAACRATVSRSGRVYLWADYSGPWFVYVPGSEPVLVPASWHRDAMNA